MPGMQIIREGDINQMKGAVKKKTGAQTVLVNGKPAAMKNKSMVVPHKGPKPPIHPINPIMKGDKTVLVEKMPIAFVGVPDSCKHLMIKKASPDVLVKGEMG